jgi:hypothetical protein
MFGFVWFFVPETKGISLEAMDQLFGMTDAGSTKSLTGVEETTAGREKENDTPRAEQKEVA